MPMPLISLWEYYSLLSLSSAIKYDKMLFENLETYIEKINLFNIMRQ